MNQRAVTTKCRLLWRSDHFGLGLGKSRFDYWRMFAFAWAAMLLLFSSGVILYAVPVASFSLLLHSRKIEKQCNNTTSLNQYLVCKKPFPRGHYGPCPPCLHCQLRIEILGAFLLSLHLLQPQGLEELWDLILKTGLLVCWVMCVKSWMYVEHAPDPGNWILIGVRRQQAFSILLMKTA